MEKYKAKKYYGQNFIKDKNILRKIVNVVPLQDNDLVIEIGMGQGDLTNIILEKNPYYIGYEIDNDLEPYLVKYNKEKSKVIFGDFLKKNIIEHINDITYNNLYVIANLPYYITTPIIVKIINDQLPVNSMVLMVQKEVADRFTAKINSKQYGSITVYLNSFFNIEKEFIVTKNNFIPKPNVDSEIICLTRNNNNELINDFDYFQNLIKDAFQFKRKTIKNNLRDYDLVIIEKVLKENNLDLNSRAEQIPMEVFVEMSNSLNFE